MSPLDRALPLSEAEHRPGPVDEHLKLDVARRGQVAFQVEPRIPERRLRLAPRRCATPVSSEAASAATRMPRPPPPPRALTITG